MYQKLINSKILVIYVIPFILGVSSVLSFQPFNLTFINFVILPFLFIILSYVNKKSKNVYKKKPFLVNLFAVGYLFGIGFFLSNNYWISYSLTFDDNFKFLIPFSIVLIPAFLGLFWGFLTLLVGPFIKNNYSSFILFVISLSLTDYLRGKIFTGFPWNLWSYSWSWFTEILQILNPIGLYAFNLIIISIFLSPVLILFKNKYKYLIVILFSLLFFTFYLYGSYLINNNNIFLKETVILKKNIKVISPNFKLKFNLNEDEIKKSLISLIRFSDPDPDKETLFVWPEGVFTGIYFEDLKKYKSIFRNNFSSKHTIIFGANTRNKKSSYFYNSFLAVNNELEILYQYNKRKLVPFGEFLPYEGFFNSIGLKKVTQGYGSFSKGEEQSNMLFNKINIFPLICYEIIFPEILQNSKNNMNLLINISEDGWFGNSIGPDQHFAKAIFRAIENNLFLVRSTNKGISGFINNRGKVLKSLLPNETGSIELDVPIINTKTKNKNDLIFFILLFTYTFIFLILKKNEK